MLTSKQSTLKPLLTSRDGVHLTAYLVNHGDLVDLNVQLRKVIDDAHDWLKEAMPIEERKKFLEPLDALLLDGRIFQHMNNNIGIFRNKECFRILNIPIDVESSCQVATSFHVKPLLRWLQSDQEFLFLGLEKESAHLFFGSQHVFRLIDSVSFAEFLTLKNSLTAEKKDSHEEAVFSWLNEWIVDLTRNSKPKLFMAGDPALIELMSKHLKYKNKFHTTLADTFDYDYAFDSCLVIRQVLRDESKRSLQRSLNEFRFADDGYHVKKNIFQIAKAVVQGKVRKIIVTDELSIFGKIDPKSGGLAIHPFDLDHEDDCILDDLAQMVLSQGGEVIVAKRDEIPKGRPILAILDDEVVVSNALDDSMNRKLYQRSV